MMRSCVCDVDRWIPRDSTYVFTEHERADNRSDGMDAQCHACVRVFVHSLPDPHSFHLSIVLCHSQARAGDDVRGLFAETAAPHRQVRFIS